MRRLRLAVLAAVVVAASMTAFTLRAPSGATELPKLKLPGLVVARVATEIPTKQASQYRVAWVDGLRFRNSDETAALCIFPARRDPYRSGLHLTFSAAQELAVGLWSAAAGQASVQVWNHRGGEPQEWERFSAADALVLADAIGGALPGG